MERENIYSRYFEKYVTSNVKTASGKRKSLDKGDKLARMLRGKGNDELVRIATEYDVPVSRWENLNAGRFRMQVGRALRMVIKMRGSIVIDGEQITVKDL